MAYLSEKFFTGSRISCEVDHRIIYLWEVLMMCIVGLFSCGSFLNYYRP